MFAGDIRRRDPVVLFIIVLMMEAVRNSEMSVYFNSTTQRCIPESCHLHTRRRENLKSHN
jgi:hypothetical protein